MRLPSQGIVGTVEVDALLPGASAGAGELLVELLEDRVDQCDGALGYDRGVGAIVVGHLHAQLGEGGDVEPVGAGYGNLDQCERRQAAGQRQQVGGATIDDNNRGSTAGGDLLVQRQIAIDEGERALGQFDQVLQRLAAAAQHHGGVGICPHQSATLRRSANSLRNLRTLGLTTIMQ